MRLAAEIPLVPAAAAWQPAEALERQVVAAAVISASLSGMHHTDAMLPGGVVGMGNTAAAHNPCGAGMGVHFITPCCSFCLQW